MLLSFLLLKTHERIRAGELICRAMRTCAVEKTTVTLHLVLGQKNPKDTEQQVRRRILGRKGKPA